MTLSLFQAAAEAPRRTALVTDGEAMTFATLALEVRGAVAWLERQGVVGRRDPSRLPPSGRTSPVGLLAERSARGLALLYALIETGVPVAAVDPRWPEPERRRWLAEVGADLLIDPAAADLSGGAGFRTPGRADALPDDERPLAIVRTSGSMGQPKGVVLSRRAFAASAAASADNLGWRGDDRWLLTLPLSHVGGLSIVTRCLAGRRAVVLRTLPRFDPASVARILEQDRVTLLSLVPTMLQRLLDLGTPPPAFLRAVLLGGAGSPPRLLERAAEGGWPVLTTYGLTEACSQVATQRAAERGERGAFPVPGMEVRVRGGAIEIRGTSLMSSYLPPGSSPPFDADGWFATGDLGRLDAAGRLHVLGRRDEVITSGGENVHPREVEEALEEHPAIAAACVFGVEDAEWGQAVAAALVSAAPPEGAELRRHLGRRLAGYQRPRRIAYLAELPRTASGKVDRRRAAAAAGPRLRRFL